MSQGQLDARFASGGSPALATIIGWEFRGYNHSPMLVDVLGIRKFIKGFFATGSGNALGYNSPVKQDGIHRPWIAEPHDEAPRRFAFFRTSIVEAGASDPDARYPGAVLLDYSDAGNHRLAIYRLLRDYVRTAMTESDDVLICKAYAAIGNARLQLNYFLLERHRRIWTVPALEDDGNQAMSVRPDKEGTD